MHWLAFPQNTTVIEKSECSIQLALLLYQLCVPFLYCTPSYCFLIHCRCSSATSRIINTVFWYVNLIFQVPPTIRFVLDGEMPPYLLAKDLILQVRLQAMLILFISSDLLSCDFLFLLITTYRLLVRFLYLVQPTSPWSLLDQLWKV